MKFYALLGLLLALSTQVFAQHEDAQAGVDHASQRQHKFDLNGDGNISREEAVQRAGARFDEADTNGDGLLTKDERMAVRQSVKEHRDTRKERRAADGQL